VLATDTDHQRWEEEERAERLADKEQIKELEEWLAKVEEELAMMKEMKRMMWVLE
jgi:hypothetical protein